MLAFAKADKVKREEEGKEKKNKDGKSKSKLKNQFQLPAEEPPLDMGQPCQLSWESPSLVPLTSRRTLRKSTKSVEEKVEKFWQNC